MRVCVKASLTHLARFKSIAIKSLRVSSTLVFALSFTFLRVSSAQAGKKVLVFDLCGVIIQRNLGKALNDLGISGSGYKGLTQEIVNAQCGPYHQYMRGRIKEQAFFEIFGKFFLLPHGFRELSNNWQRSMAGPVDGIEQVLNKIPAEYDLYTFSNLTPCCSGYLRLGTRTPLYPFLKKFKTSFLSWHLCGSKRELRTYSKVFDFLRMDHPELLASDILFLDAETENVQTGLEAGWISEKVEPNNSADVERVLKSQGIIKN